MNQKFRQNGSLIAAAVAVCTLSGSPTCAAENVPIQTQTQLNATLSTDPNQISLLYRSARTLDDIDKANQRVRAEVAKAKAAETDLAKLHNAVATSCEAARQLQTAPLHAATEKAHLLEAVLVEIDARMLNSLGQLRKIATTPEASYKAVQDAKTYEARYSDFNASRVNAQEIAKSVSRLATNIVKTADNCRPATIPPLYETADARAPSPGNTASSALAPAATVQPRPPVHIERPRYYRYTW